MFLVWCKDRADVALQVIKIHYKNLEKNTIKFKGTLFNRKNPNIVYETKNYKMSLTKFRQLEKVYE